MDFWKFESRNQVVFTTLSGIKKIRKIRGLENEIFTVLGVSGGTIRYVSML